MPDTLWAAVNDRHGVNPYQEFGADLYSRVSLVPGGEAIDLMPLDRGTRPPVVEIVPPLSIWFRLLRRLGQTGAMSRPVRYRRTGQVVRTADAVWLCLERIDEADAPARRSR